MTQLDSYTAYYYYSPAAEAYLYDTSISGPIKTAGRRYAYGSNSVNLTIDVPGSAYSSYRLVSKHYLSIVQIQYRPDLNRWYDHFNYSQRQPGEYGASATVPPGPLGYGVLILNRDILLGNTNFTLTGATPPQPTLVGPQGPVVRGDVVTYSIQNLASGAQISDWKFIDTSSNPQVAYVGTGNTSSTWAGPAVIGGTVTVKVKYGSRVFDLQGSYTVVNRPNWTIDAAQPTRVSDGTVLENVTIDFPKPPVPNRELGVAVPVPRFTLSTATVQTGPNTQFNYVAAITPRDAHGEGAFYWALHPDLENRNSTFYKAQCGDYDPETEEGFISSEQLVKNVINHEVGTTGQSHYLIYKSLMANPDYNLGVNAEKIIGTPQESYLDFDRRAKALMDQKRDAIIRVTQETEPCGQSNASLDSSAEGQCKFKGDVNSLDPEHGVYEYQECSFSSLDSQARFVNNFYLGVLARQPSNSERQTWTDALKQAMAQGQPQLIAKTQQLGTTLFQSTEYGARQRSNRDYVLDLYGGYLQRGPSQTDWDSWTNVVTTQGREAARSGIANGAEFKVMIQRLRPQLFDFDRDGKSDIGVFRPSIYFWSILQSSNGLELGRSWGRTYDKLVPGDYDGDGKTDMAVWRPSTGIWYILRSSDGQSYEKQWGASTDKPVPGDWDGDSKADIAVWRPSTGNWYILRSSDGGFAGLQWGESTDKPVPADYDGDGKTDIAVFRPSNRIWYIMRSDGSVIGPQWGLSSDRLVPGDYDGDGKAELAVWRPGNGTWYAINLTTGAMYTKQCGINTDKPVTGDYDGDGKFDPAVWRSSNNTWYILKSSYGFVTARQWGIAGDRPVPGASAGLSYGTIASDVYGDEFEEPPPNETQ
jgi:hypothetical protein